MIIGLLRELETLAPPRVLIDESGFRPGLIGPGHIRAIADQWRSSTAFGAARIAVVAPNPVIYGLNRMFQAWANEADRVAVFSSRADATAWLVA